jgi:serine protease Do
VHRDRLMEGVRSLGDFSKAAGKWELTGTARDATGERPASFKLSPQAVASLIGDAPALQLIAEPFADLPAGTGGLLAALHQFRQLLLDPQGYFTEFYYLGSEPLDGTASRGSESPNDPTGRVDVLITTKGTVTTRWYFNRPDGALVGWDTALEEDVDECSVRVLSWRDFNGRRLPERFEVRHAGAVVLTVELTQATLAP